MSVNWHSHVKYLNWDAVIGILLLLVSVGVIVYLAEILL